MDSIAARLQELGIVLPPPAKAVGDYVPTVMTGALLFVSGQLPMADGAVAYRGTVGGTLTLEEGQQAARLAALNVLAQAAGALGSLDRVAGIVRLSGFIAAAPEFTQHAAVMNGASELVGQVFGETGRHTRIAVGVATLPLGVPVEVDAIIAVRA